MDLTPGEIYWARPDPTVGREQAGRRPVLVVSGRPYLATVHTLCLAVPITTTDRGWPNHVLLKGDTGLQGLSFAMTEQIRTISRGRLAKHLGLVNPDSLAAVRRWITDFLED